MQGEGGSGFLAEESDSVAAVITTIDDQGFSSDEEDSLPDFQHITDNLAQVNADSTADSAEIRESSRPDRQLITDSDRSEEQLQSIADMTADSAETEELQQIDTDTMETEERKTFQVHLQELVDKSHPEPDFSDLFPYEGALWDSARVVLITLRSEYPDFPRNNVVEALSDELDVDRVRALLVDTDKIYECGELDGRPEIQGGLDGFLDESGFRNVIEEHQISGEVAIQVLIGKEGRPMEISTDEEDDGLGIMESLLKAVEEHMRFTIPQYTGVDVQARCGFTIEFNY